MGSKMPRQAELLLAADRPTKAFMSTTNGGFNYVLIVVFVGATHPNRENLKKGMETSPGVTARDEVTYSAMFPMQSAKQVSCHTPSAPPCWKSNHCKLQTFGKPTEVSQATVMYSSGNQVIGNLASPTFKF